MISYFTTNKFRLNTAITDTQLVSSINKYTNARTHTVYTHTCARMYKQSCKLN